MEKYNSFAFVIFANMSHKKIIYFLFFLLMTAFRSKSFSQTDTDNLIDSYKRFYYIQDFGFELPQHFNCTLYDTVENWIGTPYRFSGCDAKGIDCSGFVNTLYSKVYLKNIGARNSADIYKAIRKVDKDELKEGDLVFFRIHKHRISHVGLYLGGGKFVHASVKNGVIISDLKEPYYHKYYAGGGPLKLDAVTDSEER